MADSNYLRADLRAVVTKRTTASDEPESTAMRSHQLRWIFIIMPMALLFCIAQGLIVVLAENLKDIYMSSSLITVIGFVMLTFFLLVVNPAIRFTNFMITRLFARGLFSPFTRAELMTLFAAILVSSGVSSFGLTSQLIPIIPAPYNPEWNTELRGWQQDLIPQLNPNLYITDVDQVRLFREGVDVPKPLASATLSENIEYCKEVFTAIPWHVWVRPLASWMIFVFGCYGLFYCLAFVVLNYWSQREKLIFPLATLPKLMLPESDAETHWVPRSFRHPLFWAGALLAIGILSYNACYGAGWITGLGKFTWGLGLSQFRFMVEGTMFEGFKFINAPAMQFQFGFVAIAIAFFLPAEISFSIWFYFILGEFFLLACTWLGYRNFSTDFMWNNHQVSAMAAGGMLIFSGISLFRSLLMYGHLAKGKSIRQRVKLAMPVLGLLICIGILTRWLMWNGLPLLWALIFLGITTLVTVGVMRLVAEGGVYWIQIETGFFHLFKVFGLGKWIAPALVGPLLPIFSIMFLDIKTFIAPSILNAAKLQQDVAASRVKYHTTVIVCLVVSVAVCLTTAIFLAYMHGGQQLNQWFYVSSPAWVFDTARAATRTVPEVDTAIASWYTTGAIWVGLSTLARQFMFWFPHPIGFIMHVNPGSFGPLWFSFFIGWACKKTVIKYGGKATYDTVKLFFLGLFLGEIICCFVWPTIALLGGFSIVPGIDLNRYQP